MSAQKKCLNDKGQTLFIAEHLLTPNYLRRHKLVIDEVKPVEELKPIEQVNLKVEAPQEIEEVAENATIEDLEPIEETMEYIEPSQEVETKEKYWAILDEKGIKYNKNFGIAKLKELCQ